MSDEQNDEFGGIFNLESKDIIDQRGLPKNKDGEEDISQIELTPEFEKCLAMMEDTYQNIFITGDAGTGKSTLIKYFIGKTKKRVVKLAPTGVAAVNIKGQTVHSFFRFPPKPLTRSNIPEITQDKYRHIYRNVDTIIIDEISMVRVDMMDAIDIFLRETLFDDTPFAGKQIIMVGDLNQLPPVIGTDAERDMLLDKYQSAFFFDANVFKKSDFLKVRLTKIFRQKDNSFTTLLNKLKRNELTDDDIKYINKTCFGKKPSEGAISLTTTNSLADHINNMMLNDVDGERHVLKGKINGDFKPKNCPVDENIILKIGAKVMLLSNDPGGRYHNGTVGTLISVEERKIRVKSLIGDEVYDIEPVVYESLKYRYEYDSGEVKANQTGSFTQFPIRLAYAMTIHKSQGKTFDELVIDIGSGTFAHGQLYVAMSRCTTLEGISLSRTVSQENVIYDKRVLDFHKVLDGELDKLPESSKEVDDDGKNDLPF